MLNWVTEISVERVRVHSHNGFFAICYDYPGNKHVVEASYWVRRTGGDYPHLEIVTLCVVGEFVCVIVGAALFPVISHADTSWRPVDKNGCLVQYPEDIPRVQR